MATVAETPPASSLVIQGGNAKAYRSREREVLLAGPAGTGKSRACLEKLYYWLVHPEFPEARLAIIRKTRVSATQSALVTFQDEVLQLGDGVRFRATEQEFRAPNGSIAWVGGMGNAQERDRVKSTQFDLIYVQEATELLLDDWELLLSRLRNNRLPVQQILADCNPSAPTHWLKARCDARACRLIESRHEDNPALWDAKAREWTPLGADYLATLDALTGVRRLRLLKGLWAASEGMVYDDWDPALHVIDRFPIPSDWARYRVVDFGYTNPFVCQWWATDGDNRAYLYRELYVVETLVEDAARRILAHQQEGENIRATICDHDAEGRATLERYLTCSTRGAVKSVAPGIQAVQARLRKAGDGRPRLFVFRDAPVTTDRRLTELHRPTCTAEEIDAYVWDTREGKPPKEEPVKRDDHGMDAMRYMVAALDNVGRREMKAY